MVRCNTMLRRRRTMLRLLDSFMIRLKKSEEKAQLIRESLESLSSWSMIRLALLTSISEDRPHLRVKLEPFNSNWRKKETKVWLMRLLFANLKIYWERRLKSWIKRLVTLRTLRKRSKQLIWSSTSSGMKLRMKEERAQLTKTSLERWRSLLQKKKRSSKRLNRLSSEETVILEDLRRQLKMSEERACLISKNWDSSNSNYLLKSMMLKNSTKILWKSKRNMSSQQIRLKS